MWTLDIRKSSAIPPDVIKNNLSRIVERISEGSKRTWTFRGKKEVGDNGSHLWTKTRTREGIGTVASFVKICALKLFEGDVLPEYTPCYFQGSGFRNANLRVDGYAFDDYDGTFFLLVADYSGNDDTEVLQGSDARTDLERCRAFASNSLEHDLEQKIEMSTSAYDLASYIHEQAQYISKFVIILLTDMSLSERAVLTDSPQKPRGKQVARKRTNVLSAEPILGIEVEYRIWDKPNEAQGTNSCALGLSFSLKRNPPHFLCRDGEKLFSFCATADNTFSRL